MALKDPFSLSPGEMKRLMEYEPAFPDPYGARPTPKLEEYTALVVPALNGGPLEVRISKESAFVEVSIGNVKLSIQRSNLKQLVDKLYEELNMERLGK